MKKTATTDEIKKITPAMLERLVGKSMTYREICTELDITPKEGNGRKSHIKYLETLCEIEENKNTYPKQYVIKQVYDRKKLNDELEHIENLLGQMFREQDEPMYLSQTEALEGLCAINKSLGIIRKENTIYCVSACLSTLHFAIQEEREDHGIIASFVDIDNLNKIIMQFKKLMDICKGAENAKEILYNNWIKRKLEKLEEGGRISIEEGYCMIREENDSDSYEPRIQKIKVKTESEIHTIIRECEKVCLDEYIEKKEKTFKGKKGKIEAELKGEEVEKEDSKRYWMNEKERKEFYMDVAKMVGTRLREKNLLQSYQKITSVYPVHIISKGDNFSNTNSIKLADSQKAINQIAIQKIRETKDKRLKGINGELREQLIEQFITRAPCVSATLYLKNSSEC